MATEQGEVLKGIIEMDGCYIGGRARKENKKDDDNNDDLSPVNKRGRGTKKEAVIVAVERRGNVKVEQVSKIMLNAKGLLVFVCKKLI